MAPTERSLPARLSVSLVVEEIESLFSVVGVAPGVGREAAAFVEGVGEGPDRMYEMLLRFGTA